MVSAVVGDVGGEVFAAVADELPADSGAAENLSLEAALDGEVKWGE
jgi:hypothetical protein